METEAYTLMNEREGTFWWHAGMRRIIGAILARYAPKRSDNIILDAGCGTGGMFTTLSPYGSIYGIDQSSEAVEFASAKGAAQEVALGSISTLPYPKGMFDIVTCLDVLYHAKAGSDEMALSEFSRVLRPGGKLIVREPAYDWLRGHQDDVVWTKKRYSRTDLICKLEKAGFALEKATYVNSFLLPLAIIKRLSEHWYRQKDTESSTFRTNAACNFVFKQVLYAEAKLLPYITFPFGLSVLCVARKKN